MLNVSLSVRLKLHLKKHTAPPTDSGSVDNIAVSFSVLSISALLKSATL